MRISDWSSDVCSSDLGDAALEGGLVLAHGRGNLGILTAQLSERVDETASAEIVGAEPEGEVVVHGEEPVHRVALAREVRVEQTGSASCRQGVCQTGFTSVGAISLKNNNKYKK